MLPISPADSTSVFMNKPSFWNLLEQTLVGALPRVAGSIRIDKATWSQQGNK